LLVPPIITGITGWDGAVIAAGVHNKSIIIVKGDYFGVKLPSASMEYTDVSGAVKQVRLKVQKVYAYPDSKGVANKSCMDLDMTSGTYGKSQVNVEMPKTWWRDWGKGIYSLVLNNKIGLDTVDVSTLPSATNTFPTATVDTITLQAGESSYYIDVLANDADAEADKLTISLPDGKLLASGAKITVSKEKIKYTPPRALPGLPFTDTFRYTVTDIPGSNGATTTVTVTIAPVLIADVQQWDGDTVLGANQVQTRSTLVISGTGFGAKVPAVMMNYTEGGVAKSKKLKVIGIPTYTDYKGKANKSYTKLDPTNGGIVVPPYGTSEVRVELPSKFWKGWATGNTFTLTVSNKFDTTGATTAAITTSGAANILTAVADTFNLLSGDYDKSNYSLLDVTGNDSDINSGKFKIILDSKTTSKGGKVSVDSKTNKIKYIRPKGVVGPIAADTFKYHLQDYSNSSIISATVTDTVNIGLNP